MLRTVEGVCEGVEYPAAHGPRGVGNLPLPSHHAPAGVGQDLRLMGEQENRKTAGRHEASEVSMGRLSEQKQRVG